jgi:hypothetical protein
MIAAPQSRTPSPLLCWLPLALALLPVTLPAAPPADWLLDGAPYKAQVSPNSQGNEVTLENGLVRRVFRLTPNATTVSFENLMTGESFLRAVRPEAVVELDGAKYDVGGYSLCSSRGAGTPADNVVGKPTFGVAPCLGSKWGREYLDQLRSLMENTGLAVLEHDGSYPGDTCAATNHPYHRGETDSQWVQWKAITGLYQWCRANGVYLNVPDWSEVTGVSLPT